MRDKQVNRDFTQEFMEHSIFEWESLTCTYEYVCTLNTNDIYKKIYKMLHEKCMVALCNVRIPSH